MLPCAAAQRARATNSRRCFSKAALSNGTVWRVYSGTRWPMKNCQPCRPSAISLEALVRRTYSLITLFAKMNSRRRWKLSRNHRSTLSTYVGKSHRHSGGASLRTSVPTAPRSSPMNCARHPPPRITTKTATMARSLRRLTGLEAEVDEGIERVAGEADQGQREQRPHPGYLDPVHEATPRDLIRRDPEPGGHGKTEHDGQPEGQRQLGREQVLDPPHVPRVPPRHHAREKPPGFGQRRAAKEYPAHDHGHPDVHAADRPRGRTEARVADHPLGDQQRPVVQAPHHERFVRPVPQPAEREHDVQVHVGAGRRDAIPSQRDIQIVPEP